MNKLKRFRGNWHYVVKNSHWNDEIDLINNEFYGKQKAKNWLPNNDVNNISDQKLLLGFLHAINNTINDSSKGEQSVIEQETAKFNQHKVIENIGKRKSKQKKDW